MRRSGSTRRFLGEAEMQQIALAIQLRYANAFAGNAEARCF
jgi:hypothetical protein